MSLTKLGIFMIFSCKKLRFSSFFFCNEVSSAKVMKSNFSRLLLSFFRKKLVSCGLERSNKPVHGFMPELHCMEQPTLLKQ